MLGSFEEKQQEFKETNYFHYGATALAILILYYYFLLKYISDLLASKLRRSNTRWRTFD